MKYFVQEDGAMGIEKSTQGNGNKSAKDSIMLLPDAMMEGSDIAFSKHRLDDHLTFIWSNSDF